MDAFLHTDQSQAAVSFRLFDIEADPAVLYVKDQAATFQHVLSPGSGKEADGRARLIFHQYGKEYFLATVSHRTSSSTYDCPESKEKKRLADASPNQKLKLVTVFSNGNVSTAGHQELRFYRVELSNDESIPAEIYCFCSQGYERGDSSWVTAALRTALAPYPLKLVDWSFYLVLPLDWSPLVTEAMA